uniref:Uncharacterized protein n=1 Tax=Anopheles epiroticus TaxID=199890 RepID=A0A182PKM7_9DIPT
MSEQWDNDDEDVDGSTDSDRTNSIGLLSKRPRQLSFPELSSHPSVPSQRSILTPVASTSSNSQGTMSRREMLANYMRSWQERQIANCINDNIINTVVERYLAELRNSDDNAQQAPRPATNDNELFEDHAVRMAISARGLLPVATGAARATRRTAVERDGLAAGPSSVLRSASLAAPLPPPRGDVDNVVLQTAMAAVIEEMGLAAGRDAEGSDSETTVEEEDGGR